MLWVEEKSKKKKLLEFLRDKFHFRQVTSGVVQFKRMFVWWIGGRPSTKLVIKPVSSSHSIRARPVTSCRCG